MRALRLLVPAALLAAACGSLESPDVSTGSVTGRISGGTAAGYAYVFGHPEIRAALAADGSFRLDRVPSGEQEIVVFDGSAGAARLGIEVHGADVRQLAATGPLPLASRLVAQVSPVAGTLPQGLTFGVDGTEFQGVAAGEAGTALYPLPAGSYVVRATQPGFHDSATTLQVGEGETVPYQASLDVDDDLGDLRGCNSSSCEDWLQCNAADGRCYPCVDAQSKLCPGATCTADHLCPAQSGAAAVASCAGCAGDADCGTTGSGRVCIATNASGAAVPGYCSVACTTSDECPSGWSCSGGSCKVVLSCAAYLATYGASCSEDDVCQDALANASCQRAALAQIGKCVAQCKLGATPSPCSPVIPGVVTGTCDAATSFCL